MDNSCFMKGFYHRDQLYGEVDCHGLNAHLSDVAGFNNIDDVKEGPKLLMVGNENSTIIKHIISWHGHEGLAHFFGEPILYLGTNVKFPIISRFLHFQDCINSSNSAVHVIVLSGGSINLGTELQQRSLKNLEECSVKSLI